MSFCFSFLFYINKYRKVVTLIRPEIPQRKYGKHFIERKYRKSIFKLQQ